MANTPDKNTTESLTGCGAAEWIGVGIGAASLVRDITRTRPPKGEKKKGKHRK